MSLADIKWLLQVAGPQFAHKQQQGKGNGNDNSRSGKAFRKCATLKAAGYTYEQMRDALLADDDPGIAEWARTKGLGSGEREMRRIYKNARGVTEPKSDEGIKKEDFVAYMPQHNFIFMPTGQPWPGGSVDARLPWIKYLGHNGEEKEMAPSKWLDKNRPVDQMIWAPGKSAIIRNRLLLDGGWVERSGVAVLNLYKPPIIEPGDSSKIEQWIELTYKIFTEEDAKHAILWCAHRVQHPEIKINHALVMGGQQGIGKDTLLEPVKYTIGHWNFQEVKPTQIMGRFNGFLKSVILRVSEGRDLGEVDRYQFYDHMKDYIAAPPDVLRVDEKNLREYAILNCTGVIITTNHKAGGFYLPPDDRRHYVGWSDLKKESISDKYWAKLWEWYEREGRRNVAAYLLELDISGFDPKAPPPKTQAWWDIVDANRAPAAVAAPARRSAQSRNRRGRFRVPLCCKRRIVPFVSTPDRGTSFWKSRDGLSVSIYRIGMSRRSLSTAQRSPRTLGESQRGAERKNKIPCRGSRCMAQRSLALLRPASARLAELYVANIPPFLLSNF